MLFLKRILTGFRILFSFSSKCLSLFLFFPPPPQEKGCKVYPDTFVKSCNSWFQHEHTCSLETLENLQVQSEQKANLHCVSLTLNSLFSL